MSAFWLANFAFRSIPRWLIGEAAFGACNTAQFFANIGYEYRRSRVV